MSISVRTRFEVFKRDEFTCQYCGRRSPEVVLEVDHIVPVATGGSDDEINLRTSCWDCNRGKSDKPLSQLVTGEDPHDRAVLLLERERQLREYNEVLSAINDRIEREFGELVGYWEYEARRVSPQDRGWLRNTLTKYPAAAIRAAMTDAIHRRKIGGLAYVNAILRNRRQRGEF